MKKRLAEGSARRFGKAKLGKGFCPAKSHNRAFAFHHQAGDKTDNEAE